MSALSDHYGRLARMTSAELEQELRKQVFGSRYYDTFFASSEIIRRDHDISKTENTTQESQYERD